MPHFPASQAADDGQVAAKTGAGVASPADSKSDPIDPDDASSEDSYARAEHPSDGVDDAGATPRRHGFFSLRFLASAFLPGNAEVARAEPILPQDEVPRQETHRTIDADDSATDSANEPANDAPLASRTFADEVALAMRADDEATQTSPRGDERASRGAPEGVRPPLTRLPLRPHRAEITWTSLVRDDAVTWSAGDRLAFLRDCGDTCDAALVPALCLAYDEETGPGRVFALRALAQHPGETSLGTFREALIRGGDDERALAVDVLDAWGERDALSAALCDRIDAVAARAALAFVGGHDRAVFEATLAPFVDRARLGAILSLLAGIFD